MGVAPPKLASSPRHWIGIRLNGLRRDMSVWQGIITGGLFGIFWFGGEFLLKGGNSLD